MPKLSKQIEDTADASGLPTPERKALAINAMGGLPPQDKQDIAQAIGFPDQSITNGSSQESVQIG